MEQEAALDGLLSYSAEYWIGLSDLSVEGADTNTTCTNSFSPPNLDVNLSLTTCSGHFVWAESHQDLETTEYTHWATNQPDNGGGHEDCVVKVSTVHSGKLRVTRRTFT